MIEFKKIKDGLPPVGTPLIVRIFNKVEDKKWNLKPLAGRVEFSDSAASIESNLQEELLGYMNYVYLNDYTLYVVEDIGGTHTDPYHYKVYFDTNVIPSVEVK